MPQRVYSTLIVTLASALLALGAAAQDEGPVRDVAYTSSADDTEQRTMFYAPDSDEQLPMIVALHTWSGDYTQQTHRAVQDWCVANGWA